MRRTIFFFFIFFMGGMSLLAQGINSEDKVKQAFTKYFELPRESIFLHLNKSTYIQNENIWFKGYIYNRQKEQPLRQTTNVYVGIYDSLGNIISKKLYLARDGYVKGDIVIDSTFTSGSYYVKASTNWMRNFKEDDAFVQKIVVYNKTLPEVEVGETGEYDVQFLPEGGNLVSEVPNTLGVKITDARGYGVTIVRGIVRDENEAQVAQFTSSIFGMGSFYIIPHHSKDYYAEITFEDGTEATYVNPRSEREGISINLKNIGKERIGLTLSTNEGTRKKIRDRIFYLLAHRDGHAKRIKVSFPQNELSTSLLLEKNLLQKGMNVITLLDDSGAPLLERLFFNRYGIDQTGMEISGIRTENDSLTISVKVISKENTVKNLSISVLPENTISYNHRENVLSTFYLRPYIRGFIENPSCYFKDMNSRKEYELDLLLLTQGWSRYEWKAIFNRPPNAYFEFEQGVKIDGTVNSKVSPSDKMLLYLPNTSTTQIVDIVQNKFSIPNYFPMIGEKVKFSLIKNNKKLVRPTIFLNITTDTTNDKIKKIWKDKMKVTTDSQYAIVEVPNFILSDNTIRLDEVTLVEQKKESLIEKNIYVPKYLKGKVTEVTEDIAFSFPFITDIIKSRGYDVREELSLGSTDRVSIRVRTIQSFGGVSGTDAARVYPRPVIYLNDVRLTTFDPLYRMPTEEIEGFFIDKTGSGEGVRGAGGVIRIYTRRTGRLPSRFNNSDAKAENVNQYTMAKGFERTKKFYTPRYNMYFDTAFENFGVVHWSPEVVTNEEGMATIRILNTGLKDLSFFVEGMGEDGSLISFVKTLNLN